MESGSDVPAERSPQGRQWDSRFPAAGDIYGLLLACPFALLTVVGVVAPMRDRGFVVAPLLVGLGGLALTAYVLWNPAWHVVESPSGSFTFRRAVTGKGWTIDPGDLISIQHFKIAQRINNRMSPLVVTSRETSFRFRPPFRDADSLIRALSDANPHALVEDWVRR